MTDWEQQYRLGDTPWDKGAPSPPLVDWLSRSPVLGDILVPGCGLGHDVRALAGQTSQAGRIQVVGLDFSPSAIRAAEAVTPAGSETYLVGDLFDLSPGLTGKFDWVVEHTCFCAIDPVRRPDYVSAVHAALKPDGRLLAVFYLHPNDPGEERTGPPFGTSLAELDALFSSKFEKVDEYLPTHSYRGREGRERVQLLKKLPG